MIRKAETKDLPALIRMMGDMLLYLQKHGVNYDEDQNQYVGGMIEYLALKISTPGHTILVDDTGGEIKAMLIGALEKYPGFHQHRLVGFLEYVYPLSFSSTPLAKAFYDWVQSHNGTAVMCLSSETQADLQQVYERQGFQRYQVLMVREI